MRGVMGSIQENGNRDWRIYQSLHEAFHYGWIIHLVFLEARSLYHHGQEIGLLDDISCHLALIPSEYQMTPNPRGVFRPQRPTYVFKSEVYMRLSLSLCLSLFLY